MWCSIPGIRSNTCGRCTLSETEYISEALTFLSTWARSANLHVWVVVHPAKIYQSKDTGKRDVPTPYDIAGSAHWYNKADNILTVHRDQTAGNPLVDIQIQKVRFKHIGKVGAIQLHYDKITGRYSDPAAEATAAEAYRAVQR